MSTALSIDARLHAVAPPASCFHCNEELQPDETVFDVVGGETRGFCCAGCAGAASLIEALGLAAYYDRRTPSRGPSITPLPDVARELERFDAPSLQRSFVTFHEDGDRSATLSVSGMRCTACSWLLEERLRRLPGVRSAHFGLVPQRAGVRWDPEQLRLSQILGAVGALGYRAEPYQPDRAEAQIQRERRAALKRLGVAGLGAMQVMMFSVALYAGAFGDLERAHRDLLRVASLLVTAPVLAIVGAPFVLGALRSVRHRSISPDVPIALALLGAFAASSWATHRGEGEVYFDSVCMFLFLITLGRALERDLRARAELRIRALERRIPQVAHRVAPGAESAPEEDVPVAAVRPGDVLVVRPGETVPADGCVVAGVGAANEALLTGEASAVRKEPGSILLAGSQNSDSELRMRVERTGKASTLQQISSLLDRAHAEKPRIAVLADRIARWFVASIVLVALVVGLVWWQIDPTRVVPIVIAVLIATCPCALSLATPAALAAATHGLAARGVLITRGHALEALARVTRVVFDKTGTLTVAMPTLVEVRPVRPGVTRATALAIARALEEGVNHPLARAIRAASPTASVQRVSRFASLPGRGVEGEVGGVAYRLGRPAWSMGLARGDACVPPALAAAVGSHVVLADGNGVVAELEFDLSLRPGVEAVVAWLGARGYRTALLSGDPSAANVASVAKALRVVDARGGASPEAKLLALQAWLAAGDVVLAVGDGANDAPLLGRAQVSFAMGSGSDLARLGADAVLLDDRLDAIPLALEWGRRARRVIRQNFAWALAYNVCVLPLAALGFLPPYLAAIGMSLSSLLVVVNSLRLRRAPRVTGEEPAWQLSTS